MQADGHQPTAVELGLERRWFQTAEVGTRLDVAEAEAARLVERSRQALRFLQAPEAIRRHQADRAVERLARADVAGQQPTGGERCSEKGQRDQDGGL